MSLNKLGSFEAVALVCIVTANQILLNMPENIIKYCGSSAWINVIYVSIIAIIFSFLICKLFKAFSGKDILDVCEYTGGKWLRFIVGIAYIGLFTLIAGTSLKYFSETLKLIYFPDTPIVIILLIFLLAVTIANRIGFKAITNINLIIVPLVLISMLIIFLSTADAFSFEQLFPVLGRGVDATFFGGLTNIFAFGGISFLYFLMPMLKNTKNYKKISVAAIIISSIYLLISVTTLLLVFSFISDSDFTLSIYNLTRQIEYSRFFQRTDALFIFLWIMLLFSYLSIVVSFCLIIFKKISNVSNTKELSFCFALLLFSVSLISTNTSIAEFIQRNVYRYYEIILVFIVSFAILIWGNVKAKRKHKTQEVTT